MSDGPDNKPTKELPAVPDWAIELTKSVKTGFSKIDADMTALDGKVDTLAHGLGTVTDEVSTIKVQFAEFKGQTDEKFRSHSIPIREASKTDMQHDAAIGTLVSDVGEMKKALAANTGVTEDVKRLLVEGAKSPTVRLWGGRIAMALGFLALGYIGMLQRSIEAKQSEIKASADKQPSVTVVPVFMPADAGGPDARP
jgi:hypothetical protein